MPKSGKKRLSIGYIYYKSYYDSSDEIFVRLLEEKLNVIKLPFEEQIDLETIKTKTKDCKIIFNDSTWGKSTLQSVELTKTLEELGKTVINSSNSIFYNEDKWMFYLRCLENNIPTPKTYLIPIELRFSSKAIKSILAKYPIVLKAVYSDNGSCVEKVSNYPMFLKKLRKILKSNPTSPILAQKYIPNSHKSYRVTLINHKVKQGIIKIGKSWKQTGKEEEYFKLIKVNRKLKNICEKASRILEMDICGFDLILNNGKWYIIEANSSPALNFIKKDEIRLLRLLADYLYSVCKKVN